MLFMSTHQHVPDIPQETEWGAEEAGGEQGAMCGREAEGRAWGLAEPGGPPAVTQAASFRARKGPGTDTPSAVF